ncbi:helix-turn-helix transcriptional regulator [Brucella grignonensis]|uniref:Prophage CP4-57 regulatory family protein n=1 Tax=Brucella grignonensis TaxID=94627 RepID=A0A256FEU4_9HYPH|nr:AlpA family phage regulatory protein [Brucella grignonensis]NKB83342.1 AlpA family phage regulatory protein [Brucella grignonensis]NKB84408.1 AlpA family phage regulatory protein [Brucella grignonensis]OYR13308.1 prophage CP4-57 regulatory family protein [Brucella grignonensis]
MTDTNSTTDIAPIRFLSVKQVLDRVSISRSMLLKLRNAGDFPRAVPILEKRRGFLEHEVTAWMESRVALRDQEHDDGEI